MKEKASYKMAPRDGKGGAAAKAAGIDGLARCPYMIEYAKSNRSVCCASRQPIPCGELRLAPPPYHTGIEHDQGRHDATTSFYSVPGLFQMFRKHPEAFWISSPEQIAGFGKLSHADRTLVEEQIKALVDERAAAGVEPVHSPYTKPCWERRALTALLMNDKHALKAALEEEGADVTTKVDEPRLGGQGLAARGPTHFRFAHGFFVHV